MIICSKSTIEKIFYGDIVINSSNTLTITGVVNGNISVEENSSLIVTGVVNGNITVNVNSNSTINGVVNGTIINYGCLRIHGIVQKLNNISNELFIESNAFVEGKQY